MPTTMRYRDASRTRDVIEDTPDEYRGDVCMELRDTFDRPDLADEVGGWGDEMVAERFRGLRPYSAARLAVEMEDVW